MSDYNEPIALKELLDKNLVIPEYQRPYEWTNNYIKTLLNDLLLYIYKDNKQYTVGNIIIHNDMGVLNVVDGQQRLVTLHLLLYALDGKKKLKLSEQQFNEISEHNIHSNYLFIQSWLRRFNQQEKEYFYKILTLNIHFFYTEVETIEEAFQLFDSQNTRGKKLKPTDLLKAFHLQQIEDNVSEKTKREYVDKWEELSKDNNLNKFIEEHLFRIRKWIKRDSVFNFSNEHVDEFKGINISNNVFNFSKRDIIIYHSYEKIYNDKEISIYNSEVKFPFQIDQPIINGKMFFEYIFYFYDKFKNIKEEKNKWSDFYKNHCLNYHGWQRIGDYYLRNLFVNFSIYVITRFSLSEYEIYFRKVYRNFYYPRVEKDNSRVTYSSVKNNIDWFLKASQSLSLNFIELEKDYYDSDIYNQKDEKGEVKNNHIKQVYLDGNN